MTSTDPGPPPGEGGGARWPRIIRTSFKPAHPKVTEERIKARANVCQNLALTIIGLSILAPTITQPTKFDGWVVSGGALVAGVLLVASQAILGYLPNPNPPPPKEDEHG